MPGKGDGQECIGPRRYTRGLESGEIARDRLPEGAAVTCIGDEFEVELRRQQDQEAYRIQR